MMPVSALPAPALAVAFAWSFALMLVLLVQTLRALGDGLRASALASVVGGLAAYLAVQVACASSRTRLGDALASAFWAEVPVPFLAALVVIATAAAVLCAYAHRRRSEGKITAESVRRAVDLLPQGLLYYRPGGLVKLSNATMERISWQLLGHALQDGEAFLAELAEHGSASPAADGATYAVVELPDGSAYAITCSPVPFGGDVLTGVVATDITEEHRASELLRAENERLAQVGGRLRAWSAEVSEATTTAEVLEAKRAIHDSLGHACAVTRRFVEGGCDPQAKGDVVRMWEECATLLASRESRLSPLGIQAMDEIGQAAASLGLRLQVEGTLPKTREAMRITTLAATEAMLNAASAHASSLLISIRHADGMATLRFSNDGEPPAPDAAEGGGLGFVRRNVERAGGSMQVVWQPAFELVCTLPDSEEGYGYGF